MQASAAIEWDQLLELDELDRMVLWAMRSVAVGRLDCPTLRRAFLDLYGAAADQTLCALLVMVRLLASRAARGLRMHVPGSSAVSRDELLMLSALAAAQNQIAGEGGHQAPAELAELLGEAVDAGLTAAFHHVAGLLLERGRRLSAPVAPPVGARSRHRSAALRDQSPPCGVLAQERGAASRAP